MTTNSAGKSSPSIAVIGGGISGLAAAHRLSELAPHATIKLFEAGNRLGGVLETEQVDGFQIELGADSFITNRPAALDLCKRIGLDQELLETNDEHRRTFVVCRGKLEPVPDGFLLMAPNQWRPILSSNVLSWMGKLRLAIEHFMPRKKTPGDESLESFAVRRLGREVFERLVQPLVGGIYTADPARLSLAATLPRFLEMERKHGSLTRGALDEAEKKEKAEYEAFTKAEAAKKRGDTEAEAEARKGMGGEKSGARYSMFVTPKRGLQSLVTALVNRLPRDCVQLEAPVEGLDKGHSGGWNVHWRRDGRSAVETFDAVIVAAPGPAAAKILQGAAPEAAEELTGIPYAGSAVVSLGYKSEQLFRSLDGFGYVSPEIERRPVLACSFSSVKFAGRAPDGHVLLRAFVGGAKNTEWIKQSDSELIALVEKELSELLGVSGAPVVKRVARYEGKMPQYHVGHLQRVARIEKDVEARPGLEVCGNAYRGVGIPDCISGGEAAAARIMKYLEASRPVAVDGE